MVYKGAPIVPAKPMRPMFGMNPVLLDDKGNELDGNDQSGALCLKVIFSEIKRFVYFENIYNITTIIKLNFVCKCVELEHSMLRQL